MNILFMCVANSARSQLAEALAKNLFPNAWIESAGSDPSKINPAAIEVLNEVKIDGSKQYSKNIDSLPPEFKAKLNFVITLCAEEVCPTIFAPNAKRLHWPFPDPASVPPKSASETLTSFRSARDAIKLKLLEFQESMR